VQAAREAGRATQCQNNLRQVSLALIQHHEARREFPSGGWSYRWLPDPNAASAKDQPGSWVYGILDYMEEQPLRSLGRTGTQAGREAQLSQLIATPLSVLICPSRRAVMAYPVSNPQVFHLVGSEVGMSVFEGVRTDYAGCASGGEPAPPGTVHDRGRPIDGPGPDTLAEAQEWEIRNPVTGLNRWQTELSGASNGVIIARYPISLRKVTDGASKTYLVGEKFLETDHYDSGYSLCDDQHAYVGFDRDNQVSARYKPLRDMWSFWYYSQIEEGEEYGFHFGSAHPAAFHAAMCDGSVHAVTFDVDLAIHRATGSRDERELVSE
jgi:hypothetical protein